MTGGVHPFQSARRERSMATVLGVRERRNSPSRSPGCGDRLRSVARWSEVEQEAPQLAARAQQLFDSGRHKTIATLRADGSPRISGIECEFADGDLRFGSMAGARKGSDLRRDPRFALHGPTVDPVEGREAEWPGEAKVAGRAVHLGPLPAGEDGGQPEGDLFAADVTEVVVTGLDDEGTRLVVEWWTPEGGLRRIERE
jgi:hypothetical protein